MLTFLAAIGSILAYVTIGRTVATASWKAWRGGNPKSKATLFLYPCTARYWPNDVGRYDKSSLAVMSIDPFVRSDVNLYHWVATFLWPIKLGWSVACIPLHLYGRALRELDALTALPARLLLSEKKAKALPEPASVDNDAEPDTPEQRYLIAAGRELELLAQLDAVRFEKFEAMEALGGEAEARKLATLPGKKL